MMAAALLFSAAVVAAAPFLGQLRAFLRAAFPGRFVLIVGAAVAVAAIAVLAVAVARIRTSRLLRYGGISAAIGGAVTYSLLTATGIPEVDVVERVHFIEYGLIAVLFYRAWRHLNDPAMLLLPALAALTVGTIDEWLQWFIPNRVGEARDVFLNFAAIGCGLIFGVSVWPPDRLAFRLHQRSRRFLATASAVFLIVFGAFFRTVHAGHVIVVPDSAAFRSRYTHEELQHLSERRTAEWRHAPPRVLRRLSREDQYLDEGLWHVRRRNELWTAGDYHGAWSENVILETYFAPVLDTATYAAPASRWPAEQRIDAEQRAREARARSPRGLFVSTAEPYPIVVMGSNVLFQLGELIGVLLLAVWARMGRKGDEEARSIAPGLLP